MDYREEIVKSLAQATTLSPSKINALLSTPPDPNLGDFAFPCFTLGKNPLQAAKDLHGKLKLSSFIQKVKAAGPYLNFYLAPEIVAEYTLNTIHKQKEKYGHGKQKKKIVIEFCSPNTNKPLHLGHLRNMALGDATSRLLRFQGNKIHQVEVVNDRGIHICQSVLAYQKWGAGKKPEKKGDHFVGDFYVLFAQRSKEHEDLKKEAQELLLRWERGDKATVKLWKTMNKWVLKGFQETYSRFGIKFEKEYFESSYYQKGKELVQEGLQKNIFTKDSTAAVLAPLEKYRLPDKILLRGDETSIYITQDLYLADLRFHDFHFDRMLYVVASEQNLHFKQLFAILQMLGRPYAQNLYHLSYGLVNLPSGRMKSREGTVVDADDIMDEMASLAEKEVRSRHQHLSEKEIKLRSEQIGLAAIKFFMLRTDAVRDIVFNPEESLQFEGETGPYVQYTHARACSILRKAAAVKGKINYALLQTAVEQKLVKMLYAFPEKIEETCQHLKPHLLCRYLLDLAQAFNEFYHASPVISENKELMKARVQLVKGVQQVLENGLSLLGIAALEEM